MIVQFEVLTIKKKKKENHVNCDAKSVKDYNMVHSGKAYVLFLFFFVF